MNQQQASEENSSCRPQMCEAFQLNLLICYCWQPRDCIRRFIPLLTPKFYSVALAMVQQTGQVHTSFTIFNGDHLECVHGRQVYDYNIILLASTNSASRREKS